MNGQTMGSSLEEGRFLDNLKRRRVKISLPDAEIIGVIQRIGLRKTVVLEEVSEVKSGRKFPGAKLIFGHEILKVEFPACGPQDSLSSDEESRSETHTFRRMMVLDRLDEEDCVNNVLIDELHEKFGPAVMHIQEQEVIGVGADLSGPDGQERICWLQVATKKVVYLFDILLLGGQAFKNGLCMILESRHILKVLHDCRCVARCLRTEFRVNLTNVFDTQCRSDMIRMVCFLEAPPGVAVTAAVSSKLLGNRHISQKHCQITVADLMLFFNETGGFLPDRVGSLQEVLRLHLKLPTADLRPLWSKERHAQECPEVWYARPCPPALLSVMAATVRPLLPLRLLLLDALLSDYTVLVDAYMSIGHNQPLHFNQSESALPREAEELLSVRRERVDWASQRYSLTNDGLLDRSSFRPSSHTHTHT